mmetsp:Transcript_4680/g.5129  ORF Transcript_4680/g.5129 Transcript_4680/m.5129 type:complete len:369 (+) Transcript_4680:44-1150(+)
MASFLSDFLFDQRISIIKSKDLFNSPISELPILLDLRKIEEFQDSHIQGAISLPFVYSIDLDRNSLRQAYLECIFNTMQSRATRVNEQLVTCNGGYPDSISTIFIIFDQIDSPPPKLIDLFTLLLSEGLPIFYPNYIEVNEVVDASMDQYSIEWSKIGSLKVLESYQDFFNIFPFLTTRGHGMRYGSDTPFGRAIAMQELRIADSISNKQGAEVLHEPEIFFPQMIEEWGLFLGANNHASDARVLNALNITTVINITRECANHFESTLLDNNREIEYFRFPADDQIGQPMVEYWKQGYELIVEGATKGKRILVHCAAGRSRSASLVVYYMMISRGWTVDESLAYVKKCRSRIFLNSGFIRQLREDLLL